jgi:NAD(P)-dependent dehydrogenase (short-subunit alcohol dehydrogenase family)
MKTILISGSTDGIGKQTALELARKGHRLIVHGRNGTKGLKTIEEISSRSGNDNIHYFNADLGKFDDIVELVGYIKNNFTDLDVLINNAGVFENRKTILKNGFEKTFMINHLAAFVLTMLLLDMLKDTAGSRVVNLSSMAQATSIDFNNMNAEKYFDPYNAYAVSKLCNILFTYKLSKILGRKNPTVNCLHPGVISTKLLYAGWGIGGGSLEKGASTSVYLAINDELENVSGKYFVDSSRKKSVAISYDYKVQDKLWEISEKMMMDNI